MRLRGKQFPHIILPKTNIRNKTRKIKIYNDDGDKVEITVKNRAVKLPNKETIYNLDLKIERQALSNGKIKVIES